MIRLALPAWCLLLLGLAGCAGPKYNLPPRTGDPVVDGENAIEHGPPKDRVLWQCRTSLAAMRRQLYPTAIGHLDQALARIEGVFAYDRSAQKSRRLFNEEAKKTFIGEPYERVMAYYYRGILYWMNGEPDNARACFRSGQIHDSDTVEKQYASDYVLLDYLEGLATTRLGGDGSDSYQRALANARWARPPPYNPGANVLVFVDFGPGPRKYASGDYGEELRFQKIPTPLRSARLTVAGTSIPMPAYDDLYYQATTRGGRVMDHILGNKAVFKSATSAVGDAAIISGAILASGHRHSEAGLGLLAAGALAKVLSAATRPDADTRSWNNLPRYLTFASLELPPGDHDATLEFLDESNIVHGKLTRHFTLSIPEDAGPEVFYLSDQSIITQPL